MRTEHGWLVGGVDTAGSYRVQPLGGEPWWIIRPDTVRGGVLPPYRLAPATAGVLLTEAEPPFRTWPVSAESVGAGFVPSGANYPRREGVQQWVSGPVVDLGEAMVQTLADLASDRRVMVVYDSRGREVSKTVIDVPMALVGITRDRRHVVAVRNLGEAEVVLYRWSWRSDNDQGAER